MENFMKAAKYKVRFKTNVGEATVEQLFTLGDDSLEVLANELADQVEAAPKRSFFKRQTKENTLAQLKLDIVLAIIEDRLSEREAAQSAKEKKEFTQKIQDIIAQKEEQDLYSKSVDELKALLK